MSDLFKNHIVGFPKRWLTFYPSLLKEAQPLESKRTVEMGEEHRHRHGDDDDLFEVEEAGERKMLSRYGIWLLVELCKPKEDIPIVS